MRMKIYLMVSSLLVVSGSPVSRPEIRREPYGRLASPNYPRQYSNNVRKEWIIRVREGYHIKFRFTAFDLEDSYEQEQGPCVYDYVLVTEGSETLGRFCGNEEEFPWDAPRTNDWFYTKGNETHFVFVSDYSNEGISPTGFSAHYVEEDNDECAEMRFKSQHTLEDWDELIVCDHFCNNIPGSYYCSCRAGYELHSNQHTCVAVAGCRNKQLIADDGMMESPDYPNPYAKLSTCLWNINVRDGLSVHLTFDPEFGVEEHDDEGCVYDILQITYRETTDTYCGTRAPNNGHVMDMNSRHVLVSFKTDLSVEKKGFRIYYNTSRIRCLQPLTDPQNGSLVEWQRKNTNMRGDGHKSYYEFDDVVTFKCDIGYDLIGQQRVECLSNGSWDSDQPYCKIKSCGRPENLTNVKFSHIEELDSKRFEYLEKVTVDCDDWYEMTGGSATWRCEDSKEWMAFSDAVAPNPPYDFPKCRPKCGRREVEEDAFNTQSSGGKKVNRQESWPWMAFVDLGAGRRGDQYCGGTLVDEKTVITAAHCIYPLNDDEDVTVWVGFLDRTNYTDAHFTQSFRVPYQSRHYEGSYGGGDSTDDWNFDGDIAVLKLDKPVEFSYYVHPICIPNIRKQESIFNDYWNHRKKAVVTGWGKTERGILSKDLLRIKIPFVDRLTCANRFVEEMPGYSNLITDNMLCAGIEGGRKDTCQGDSGGPLMTESDNLWYLSGVVSFGSRDDCGKSKAYGVYTNVAKYDEFLRFNLEV